MPKNSKEKRNFLSNETSEDEDNKICDTSNSNKRPKRSRNGQRSAASESEESGVDSLNASKATLNKTNSSDMAKSHISVFDYAPNQMFELFLAHGVPNYICDFFYGK